MAAGRLWLFELLKSLVERFGEEFFRALPTGPGVYLMCSESERVLYLGKARNLRKRLCSYRAASSGCGIACGASSSTCAPPRKPRAIARSC